MLVPIEELLNLQDIFAKKSCKYQHNLFCIIYNRKLYLSSYIEFLE